MGCVFSRRGRVGVMRRGNLNTEESFFINKSKFEVVITHGSYPGYDTMADLAIEKIKEKFQNSKILRKNDFSRETIFEIKAKLPSSRSFKILHSSDRDDDYIRPSNIPTLLGKLSELTDE